MLDFTRRGFVENILKTLVNYALLDAAISSAAIGSGMSEQARLWSRQMNTLTSEVRTGKVTPTEWQDGVEQIYAGIELSDLLAHIDFVRLQRSFEMPEKGAKWIDLDFRRALNLTEKLTYTTRIFGMQKGRSIVPHGHHNLLSGHLIIKGDLHVRNFERLRDEGDSLVIRPTLDKVITVRDCSTQSSLRNNVHWFTALSSTAFTFDVIVQYLNPDEPCGVDCIDPLHAEKLGDGSLRARRLSHDEARMQYGGVAHHV